MRHRPLPRHDCPGPRSPNRLPSTCKLHRAGHRPVPGEFLDGIAAVIDATVPIEPQRLRAGQTRRPIRTFVASARPAPNAGFGGPVHVREPRPSHSSTGPTEETNGGGHHPSMTTSRRPANLSGPGRTQRRPSSRPVPAPPRWRPHQGVAFVGPAHATAVSPSPNRQASLTAIPDPHRHPCRRRKGFPESESGDGTTSRPCVRPGWRKSVQTTSGGRTTLAGFGAGTDREWRYWKFRTRKWPT